MSEVLFCSSTNRLAAVSGGVGEAPPTYPLAAVSRRLEELTSLPSTFFLRPLHI